MNQQELNILFHCAVKNKLYDAVNEFIERGADINSKDKDGILAIFSSFYLGDFKIFKLLIEKGANVTLTNEHSEAFIYRIFLKGKSGDYIFSHQDGCHDIRNYVKTYHAQQIMINNFPNIYIELNKLDALDDKIKEEYKHLLTGTQLNLL